MKENKSFRYNACISPVEYNGVGWAIRKITKYPDFLPLALMAEHAVELTGQLYDYETLPRFFFFFVWNTDKMRSQKSIFAFKVRVAFPPLYLLPKIRKTLGYIKSKAGGVYFPPHPLFSDVMKFSDNPLAQDFLDRVFSKLGNLRPVKTICLAQEDFCEAEKRGISFTHFDLVTAGHNLSLDFIENVSRIILEHDYVVAPMPGTFFTLAVYLKRPVYYVEMNLSLSFTVNNFSLRDSSCPLFQRQVRIIEKAFDPSLAVKMNDADIIRLQRQALIYFTGYPLKFDYLKISLVVWLSLLLNFDKVLLFFWRRYKNRVVRLRATG